MQTQFFRTPAMAFLYERGWRQNFNAAGFPGMGRAARTLALSPKPNRYPDADPDPSRNPDPGPDPHPHPDPNPNPKPSPNPSQSEYSLTMPLNDGDEFEGGGTS